MVEKIELFDRNKSINFINQTDKHLNKEKLKILKNYGVF